MLRHLIHDVLLLALNLMGQLIPDLSDLSLEYVGVMSRLVLVLSHLGRVQEYGTLSHW